MKKIIVVFLLLLFDLGSFAQISPEILDSLKNEMGKDGRFYGRYVGNAHATADPFKAFESFVELSSIEQKVECLKSKNTVVQAYAFWGLALADSSRAALEYKKVKRKKKKIDCWLYGCIIDQCTLEVLMNTFLYKPREMFIKK